MGAAASTGNGDLMMRFLPSYRAVLNMAKGMDPNQACLEPLKLIASIYKDFEGSMICVSPDGRYGGAAYGWYKKSTFHYSVRDSTMDKTTVVEVPVLNPRDS